MKSKQKPELHQDWIDNDAIDIVQRLEAQGHTTYLVGGCVRDLLVGIHPKDYDIATTARPEEVRKCIPRSYIIGKRFRLVLVKRGERQYEVATFRRNFEDDEFPEGAPSGDNVFGTPEEDASRRDFTINSLFYDPVKDELIDYNDGLDDIEVRILRMIGDAEERLVEDPIRILRALRLAHKLGFSLDPDIRAGISKTAHSLPSSVLPRRREEILKILRLKDPALVFQEAFDLGVLEFLSPSLNNIYLEEEKKQIFTTYLHRLPHLVIEPDSPTQLFGILALAYFRALESSQEGQFSSRCFREERHCDFFKNELGLFKYEVSFVAKSAQIFNALTKTEDFRRKGERRRLALLKNEAFPLSLLLAEADFLLAPNELSFWHETFAQALPMIEEMAPPRKKARRKSQWKRKDGKKPGKKPKKETQHESRASSEDPS